MFKSGDVLLYEAPAWKFSNIIPKLIRLITGDHKMYLEYVIPASAVSWVCFPVPTCANTDTVINTNIYITIQNLSTSS
jgi:hypothetical protein